MPAEPAPHSQPWSVFVPSSNNTVLPQGPRLVQALQLQLPVACLSISHHSSNDFCRYNINIRVILQFSTICGAYDKVFAVGLNMS